MASDGTCHNLFLLHLYECIVKPKSAKNKKKNGSTMGTGTSQLDGYINWLIVNGVRKIHAI